VNYLSFQKPSRYINNELNSIHKKAPLSVALAFPDLYEIGMSHLGLKILYSIINNIPYASAERVFSPWTDMEEAMKKGGILLSSLESGRPLKDFDIVGFSLQYELSYTTVLNMLYLGGIPIRSEGRFDKKETPVIIAGGPCTLNPFPMSPFIDAFLIGDGEDAVKEVLDICYTWKREGSADRQALLKSLSEIEGIFVPSFGKKRKIKRRIIPSLENAPFPVNPVVPFASIIHDRVNIEISRGCSMGCRFCQAGMAYRPVRERSPERILDLAEQSLKNTGYESISFTSLSSGDYSCLPLLLKEFNRRFSHKRIGISLPSLRVATVNSGMLREIREVRKTGFTIAPEAGTERLRSVINKDFSEETYVSALETLFKEGWHNLKLYFMTGLPTETHEDIAAIPEMVLQAIKISKRLRGRHVNISVGVSSFIPKPHTPFQWFGQNALEILKEKNSYLRKALLKRGIKYKGHNEDMSLLEAVFARGDESIAGLIENAWALGCRLDAWTEVFDFEKWKRAMETSHVDAEGFARKEYDRESLLPWENIETGVTKEYLWKEYINAVSGTITKDCRKRCTNCGLKCKPEWDAAVTAIPAEQVVCSDTAHRPALTQNFSGKIRIRYSKAGNARYLSHLELTTTIIRALRRANFPLKYSEGFHPVPKLSFGPALGVGVSGLREYLDIELLRPFEVGALLAHMNGILPEGIRVNTMVELYGKERSLNNFVTRYIYDIRKSGSSAAERFLEKPEVLVTRHNSFVNIREMVEDIYAVDDEIYRLTVRDLGEVKVRLGELLPEIFDVQPENLDITRIAMFGWDGDWVEPLEGEKVWAAKS
jgi:radical SAM-linked protein